MQFTLIESDDKVVNKATASNNHFFKITTENKEGVRSRPGDISNY